MKPGVGQRAHGQGDEERPCQQGGPLEDNHRLPFDVSQVRREARNDSAELKEAKAWYEDQREGLGEEYALSIEEAIERISRNPELYAIVREDVRQVLVRRFPYVVYYRYENDKSERIVILAVFHASRDPENWQSRN